MEATRLRWKQEALSPEFEERAVVAGTERVLLVVVVVGFGR
jgi:hypothetical protein